MLIRFSICVMVALMCLLSATDALAWNVESDTWRATDALDRSLPDYSQCGAPRANRSVGLFYFLWLGQHGIGGPYDITKILAGQGTWGPAGAFHHWGESELGYYLSDDEYVIRKHCQMLVDAGVDTLIFDCTNSYLYTQNYMTLLRIFQSIRDAGGDTPQVCFFLNGGSPQQAQQVYDELYANNLYPDLWFRWNGKPLVFFADPSLLSQQLRDYFTVKIAGAWHWNTWFGNGYDKWCWLDDYLQLAGWHTSGVDEEVSVCVAQHPLTGGPSRPPIGRSFHNGQQPPPGSYQTDSGPCFAEQWNGALQIDPQFVWITGWNEWTAQRFISDGNQWLMGNRLSPGDTYFVDLYNQEFSRDIEPMKGGHTDNYYYQMVGNIRKYKGIHSPIGAGLPRAITIDGDFSDWADVSPEYRDALGDTERRNSVGWGSAGTYANNTARNDIVRLNVARDDSYVYFCAETCDNLTPYSNPNWMLLFIDSDRNKSTGWHGYDYVLNYPATGSTTTTLKRSVSGWNWTSVSDTVPYRVSGNKMEIAVPRSQLGQGGSNVAFDFHWADNIQVTDDITEFFVSGDSAPDRRFDYRYDTSTPGPPWEFSTNGDTESWSGVHVVSSLRVENGCLVGEISGADPYIYRSRYPDINADVYRFLRIRMKINSGTAGQVYWGTPAEPYPSESRHVIFPQTTDGQFHDYLVDMSANSEWRGTVNSLRIDPTGDGASGHFEIDYIRPVCLDNPETPPMDEWEFDRNGTTGGWVAGNGIANLAVSGGSMSGNVVASDPYLVLPEHRSVDANRQGYIHIRMRIGSGTTAKIAWQDTGGTQRGALFSITADSQFHDYVVKLSGKLGWSGLVRAPRIDPSEQATSGQFDIDFIRFLPVSPGPPWLFNTNWYREGWVASNGVIGLHVVGGCMQGILAESNGYIAGPAYPEVTTQTQQYAEIVMKVDSGTLGVFGWHSADGLYNKVQFPTVADGQFHTYFVDLSSDSNWTGTVNSLDMGPAVDASSGQFEIDSIHILRDTTGPSQGSVVIDSGASCTNSTTASLALAAQDTQTGVAEMQFSNDGTNWSDWIPYSTSASWTLNAGDGENVVSVRFKDRLVNISTVYTDQILLDTTPPSCPPAPADDGAYTAGQAITFTWEASTDFGGSGVSGYVVKIGSFQDGADSIELPLGNVNSTNFTGLYGRRYYCWVRAIDLAGNLSPWSASSDGITLVEHAGVSIPVAKRFADGSSVGLSSKTVSGLFNGFFYIEESGRNSGIRIVPVDGVPAGIVEGSTVDVGGILRTSSSGERWLEATVSR